MMFDLTVRYLGFLKHVTLLAWLFDSMLMIWNLAFHRSLALSIEELETRVASWEGITVSMHRYGGRQFNYCEKEIGHVHSNGLLDVRLSRTIKELMLKKGLVKEHHLFRNSGWISFYVRAEGDVEKALRLLKTSMMEMRSKQKRGLILKDTAPVPNNPRAMLWPSPTVK
jgi:hypothetical protein